MSERVAKRFEILGRVQGVGFRWWTVREARGRGIAGTVRNREDGAVVVEATGTVDALVEFGRALEQGPPTARVDEVRAEPGRTQDSNEFRILR